MKLLLDESLPKRLRTLCSRTQKKNISDTKALAKILKIEFDEENDEDEKESSRSKHSALGPS